MLRGQYGGETIFGGLGAGGEPTAVAVVSDLLAIAREGAPCATRATVDRAGVSPDVVSPYYIRFTVADRPGIIAALAAVFAQNGINIDAVLQQPGFPEGRRPFVVSLDPAPSSSIDTALKDMAEFDFHEVPPIALPVLSTLAPSGEGRL
jgi:homoserine dehydrogenase